MRASGVCVLTNESHFDAFLVSSRGCCGAVFPRQCARYQTYSCKTGICKRSLRALSPSTSFEIVSGALGLKKRCFRRPPVADNSKKIRIRALYVELSRLRPESVYNTCNFPTLAINPYAIRVTLWMGSAKVTRIVYGFGTGARKLHV